MSSFLKKAENLLKEAQGKALSQEIRIGKALELSALLLEATLQEKTPAEKKREAWLARMVQDPQGRQFLTAMTDQCFRSHSSERTADQLIYLLKKYGIPKFLNDIERVEFLLFRLMGKSVPSLCIPPIRYKIKKEIAAFLLPQNVKKQNAFFKINWKKNNRINLNHLGEAILGEDEAEKRLADYLSDLANPRIEYISVKISAIFSQINTIGFETTVELLAEKLRLLYRAAKNNIFRRVDGTEVSKFVNLDMEEYKDLALTLTLFTKVLDEPEFYSLEAGIVLQSYLPDAYKAIKHLTDWSKARVEKGGSSIKIRIVKGANLLMEKVESSLRGWELATYTTKIETDANFKRIVEFACRKENARSVHLGIGSHNLFDLAFSLLIRAERQVEPWVQFEMLLGMAPSLMRVLKQLAGEMVLYCPDAKESDFHSALAYLIRRLDENCGSDNFLRHFFALKPGNAIWQEETKRFKEGFSLIDTLPEQPRRKQSRLHPIRDAIFPDLFVNEPDTDFSLKDNREWIDQIYTEWKKKKHPPIPLAIGGEDMITVLEQGFDPSLPGSSSYMYSLADIPLVEKAISCAEKNLKHWSELPLQQKKEIFWQVAQVFRKKRGELIGVMIADGGKTAREADPEVSEAIDFLDYYTRNWEEMLAFQDICWKPKGIVLIAPPWNFPCSIPVSGIAAALLAGNCVIFKPAPETPLVGWHVVQAFWEGGVPKEILQMINCKEEPIGNYLIKHPKLASVILTGSSQTARTFLNLHPGLDLHAETGGKNAIIVTAMCDRDLAIRDIISSAFGHSGQKCSACSLAILEAEIYDDLNFQERLLDAANSLKVASAWDKSAKITPLIKPPEGALKRGLTTLEAGESWLLQPKENSENPHLWSPGIKWGVQKKGFTHQTELFGPVLGVMRAKNLDDAIELANGTPYGLTSGLHTLDEREQQKWKQRIIAGNLYINRGITGAIVKRQPFGGCKASSFGSGGKAGGPNYVLQFAHLEQLTPPRDKGMLPSNLVSLISILSSLSLSKTEKQAWKTSVESYAYWAPILKAPKDPAHLQGQHNFFYHIPLEKVHVRIDSSENLLPLLQVIAACLICQTSLEISTPHPLPKLATIPGIKIVTEGEAQLFDRKPARIRLLSPPSIHLKQQAAKNMIMLHCQPVLANGRFELLHYLREITLSIDYHRYGYFA